MNNKKRHISDTANTETSEWKSKERRNMMVKKMAEYLIRRGPPSWTQNSVALKKTVEKIEEEGFASAKDETEYMARISTQMRTIAAPHQSNEPNLLLSKVSSSGERKEAKPEWQEQMYHKIQTIEKKYFTKLNILYRSICRRHLQHESIPQQSKTAEMEKCKHHKEALEYIFALFKVNKSEITPEFEQKLDKVEMYIQFIDQSKSVSSHSKISQMGETSVEKPTSQVTGVHSSHLKESNFHEMAKQFGSLLPQENQVFVKQGNQSAVQQQTSGEITSPVINTSGILSSPPMLEKRNEVKENCQDEAVISNDSSPAMQHLIKGLNSVSTEALVAFCEEIRMIMHLNDDKSIPEPLNGPPIGDIGSKLEGVIATDSQARYLTRRDFTPRERKMNRFIMSTPSGDSFVQSPSAGKPLSNSMAQEHYTLSEEIKEINRRLIDTEVAVIKEETFPGVIEGGIKHGEGLTVKLSFNSVTVNLEPILSDQASKKSIINPLWLHIPASYPHGSVVVLDEMSSEASNDLDDLTRKAKLKLNLSLKSLDQPLSLKDIATSWDHCVRETICEYAQLHGGGTFTSKYGGWETCLDSS